MYTEQLLQTRPGVSVYLFLFSTFIIKHGLQVCALQWNRHDREILSSHGFSQNQLCLWKYPSMVKVAEFTGHTSRVLHLAQSPDGTTVVR